MLPNGLELIAKLMSPISSAQIAQGNFSCQQPEGWHNSAQLKSKALESVTWRSQLTQMERDWNEKAGSSETCFIEYDEHKD